MTDCIPQLLFSFYPHQPIRADFSGPQITSDAGLLPLRAFDQRHHLTRELAAQFSDPRQEDRVRHDSLALLRQPLKTNGGISSKNTILNITVQRKPNMRVLSSYTLRSPRPLSASD